MTLMFFCWVIAGKFSLVPIGQKGIVKIKLKNVNLDFYEHLFLISSIAEDIENIVHDSLPDKLQT